MKEKAKLFVISGPSGVGKNTIVAQVLKDLPDTERAITATTRRPRQGEQNGKDYYFISSEEFKKRVNEGQFLEWAIVHGETYGTPLSEIEEKLTQGKSVIAVVDVQGAKKIKQKKREAVFIFIAPPSFAELKKRLKARRTEDAKSVEVRIATAQREMAESKWYDYVIINKQVGQAAKDLQNFIKSQS